MTRFILTTAALAACLSTGAPIATPIPSTSRVRQDASITAAETPAPLRIGGQLLAVQMSGSAEPGSVLGVSVLLPAEDADPGEILLWAGRKNGWGSTVARAEPVPGIHGLRAAAVLVPDALPDTARLWISVARGDQRPARESLPLRACEGTPTEEPARIGERMQGRRSGAIAALSRAESDAADVAETGRIRRAGVSSQALTPG